jgi:Undecaprenyl-phosphate galactose phosphotransferase WbaP
MEIISQNTEAIQSRRARAARILNHTFARPWMGLVLLLSDALSLFMAGGLALYFWSFIRSDLIPQNYSVIVPFMVVFALVYTIVGLYPAVGISPVEEFRLLTLSTTLVFFGLGTLSFYLRNVEHFSRASFGLAWLFAIILLPVTRHAFRKLCTSLGFWGEPVVLIGFGEWGARIFNVLVDHPELGLRPVAIIDGFTSQFTPKVSIPYYSLGGEVDPDRIGGLTGVKTAILIHSEIPPELREKITTGRWHEFSHLIIIPDGQFGSSVWIEAHDIGGVLGLEVRQKLFSRYEQMVKRVLDIILIVLASPFLAGLFIFLALMIRLESPGPITYRQIRLGKAKKAFSIWKFRTMVENADKILYRYLRKHPDLAEEWKQTHKLKNDPRVTRVGKFLRRFSLDEFPQILNVLQGDMSLVGPRPIVDDETKYYGMAYHLYTRVKPGMTGLWQVSGRNDTSYEQRVQLDLYYVNNWSMWLDVYILVNTIKAVIFGKGAY